MPTRPDRFRHWTVPVGLVVSCVLVVTMASAREQAGRGSILDYAAWAGQVLETPPDEIRVLDELEQRVLELAAKRREDADAGLASLEVDPALSEVARVHGIDMLQRGYTGHVGPDGRDVTDRIGILYRRFVGHVGENLAEHTGLAVDELAAQTGPLATKLVDGFMQSESHRENLLSRDYTHQGIAATAMGERLLVVQVFGLRRAMLEQPLPLTVSAGEELSLTFADGAGLRTPRQFGFARPDQPADEIVTLELSSNAVSVDPGNYRLKFFLPTGETGLFDVADGPLLVVE